MVFALFTALFSIWFMTYSRTSIVLMAVLVGLYLFFAILFRTRENWEKATLLVVTCLLGFFITSTWGPQEVSRRASIKKQVVASAVVPQKSKGLSSGSVTSQKKIEKRATPAVNKGQERAAESVLFQNTVKSTVDTKSRSNPARLEDFLSKIEIFKEYPFMGAETRFRLLLSFARWKKKRNQLTYESRQRLLETQSKGIFQSLLGGGSLSVSSTLCARGVLGFSLVFVPLLSLGVVLFVRLFKVATFPREIGITLFVSCAGSFLSAFSQSLWFLFFWSCWANS